MVSSDKLKLNEDTTPGLDLASYYVSLFNLVLSGWVFYWLWDVLGFFIIILAFYCILGFKSKSFTNLK